MNPKERALYLKQKHSAVLLPDDEATVASATPASLRSFLRQASTLLNSLRTRLFQERTFTTKYAASFLWVCAEEVVALRL